MCECLRHAKTNVDAFQAQAVASGSSDSKRNGAALRCYLSTIFVTCCYKKSRLTAAAACNVSYYCGVNPVGLIKLPFTSAICLTETVANEFNPHCTCKLSPERRKTSNLL